MKDYFISYTGTDEKHATWIAALLEENGYSVVIQAWDFRPGDNFVSKINESLIGCKQLIIILSKNYLNSKWCEREWTAKLAEQADGPERRVIPVKVEQIRLSGLLSPIVYIDIVDKTENEAKNIILQGLLNSVNRMSSGYPQPFTVEHLQIDIDYCVSNELIIYQKKCKFRVLKGGKDRIANRITWFSGEDIAVTPLTPGTEIEKLLIKDTNFNFNVVFDHMLRDGEIGEYVIHAELSNAHGHFDNFFSTQVITPIGRLGVHLRIENGAIPERVYTQKLSDSVMSERTESPKEYAYASPFHWYVDEPELHFEYKIYW